MDQEVRCACVWRQATGVSGLGGHRKRQASAISRPGGHRKRQVSGVRVDERVDAGRDRSVVSGWMNGWTQEETGQWFQWARWTHGWTQEEGLSVGDWAGEGIDGWLADG